MCRVSSQNCQSCVTSYRATTISESYSCIHPWIPRRELKDPPAPAECRRTSKQLSRFIQESRLKSKSFNRVHSTLRISRRTGQMPEHNGAIIHTAVREFSSLIFFLRNEPFRMIQHCTILKCSQMFTKLTSFSTYSGVEL